MADDIRKLLDSYNANTLWEMANAAGLRVTDERGKRLGKKALIRKMEQEFFTRERVLDSLSRLNERERAVLNRLLLRGGVASTRSLRRETHRAGLVTVDDQPPRGRGSHYYHSVPYAQGYAGHPHRHKSTEFVDVIARLTYHGLVFSKDAPLTTGNTPYKLQFHPGATLFVPQAVRRHLPEPEPIPAEAAWQPEETLGGDPALLLRDLYLYWDFVRRHKVSLLKNGQVGKRSLKAINAILLVPDPTLEKARREEDTERLYLLRLLLEGLSLVCRQGGSLRLCGDDPLHIPPFWSWSEPRQIQACLKAWTEMRPLGNKAVSSQYYPRAAHARQVLLDTLKAMMPAAWIEIEELVEEIADRDPNFLFAEHSRLQDQQRRWSYYYSSIKDLLDKLVKAEQKFVRRCVTGFLHQIGAVELGRVGQRWVALRLTPVGQALVRGETPPAPAEAHQGRLIVQPNFQVMALGPVSLAHLAWLDLCAERTRADRGAFEYRISRDSIYRAQQLGLDARQVLHFLQELHGGDLPQNVRRSLEEWHAHHERIVFRSGVDLLQAADGDLLASFLDDDRIGPLLARGVAPDVAFIAQGQAKELIAALVQRGLFPAVSGDQPSSADKSVLIAADGTIRPVHAVSSLHLRGRLARLAEEQPDGTWKLTPRSVRRAGGSRQKVLRLLEELGRLHRGRLPEGLVAQLKAWGNYYGNAAHETLTLIEFHDRNALTELLAHPDLQPFLRPFPTQDRPLAVVVDGQLAAVREVLARLGVHLREGLDAEAADSQCQ